MKRPRLRNKFLSTKSDIDRKAYNKQRNYVVSLLRNDKKNFYSNLDIEVVTDNRTFWKTVKPLLSEKVTKHFKINLFEGDKVISRDEQIAKKFSEYFINIPILNTSNGYKCPDILGTIFCLHCNSNMEMYVHPLNPYMIVGNLYQARSH